MVKALFKFAMIVMATLSLTVLSACGDDDDAVQTSSDLVGVWVFNDELEDGYTECDGLQLNSDGTGTEGEWDTNKKKFTAYSNESFTWSAADNRIVIYYTKWDEIWISNYFINGKLLFMWEDDEEVGQDVYRKVK